MNDPRQRSNLHNQSLAGAENHAELSRTATVEQSVDDNQDLLFHQERNRITETRQRIHPSALQMGSAAAGRDQAESTIYTVDDEHSDNLRPHNEQRLRTTTTAHDITDKRNPVGNNSNEQLIVQSREFRAVKLTPDLPRYNARVIRVSARKKAKPSTLFKAHFDDKTTH
jgi:hypothetical protein